MVRGTLANGLTSNAAGDRSTDRPASQGEIYWGTCMRYEQLSLISDTHKTV